MQHLRIPFEIFEACAVDISNYFVGESKEIYYIPYKGKSETDIKQNRRGKLFVKYQTQRRSLKSLKSFQSLTLDGQSLEDDCDAIINPDLSYLEENTTDISTITIKWTYTFKERQSIMERRSIECYMQMFPILKQPEGLSLLIDDFDKQYANYANRFKVRWPSIAKYVVLLLKKKDIVHGDDIDKKNGIYIFY